MATSQSFQIVEIAGAGTYGTVVKARDLRRQETVALKVLKADHLDNPQVVHRTVDEALILQRLDHPNIVAVHAIEEIQGRPVVIMEWVDSIALGDLVDRCGKLPAGEALAVVRDSALALDHAWHRLVDGRPMRLVHRDLKPNNVLLSVQGVVKVVDFGIAKADFEGRRSTTQSMVLGTRAYLAPERLDGAEDSPAGDVYALGLILYELLQGKAMSLSLNMRYHAARLDRRMFELRAAGFTPDAWSATRKLITQMCSYEPEDRPTHSEIAATIDRILLLGDLGVDLQGYAHRNVIPLHRSRRAGNPKTDKHYPEVAFLDAGHVPVGLVAQPRDGEPDPRRVAEVDEQIRQMLSDDRWETRLPALQRLLARSPEWSQAPFIEVLDAALAPRWQNWQRPPSKKVAVALELLRRKPSPDAVQRAAALAAWPDRLVAMTAKALLAEAH